MGDRLVVSSRASVKHLVGWLLKDLKVAKFVQTLVLKAILVKLQQHLGIHALLNLETGNAAQLNAHVLHLDGQVRMELKLVRDVLILAKAILVVVLISHPTNVSPSTAQLPQARAVTMFVRVIHRISCLLWMANLASTV